MGRKSTLEILNYEIDVKRHTLTYFGHVMTTDDRLPQAPILQQVKLTTDGSEADRELDGLTISRLQSWADQCGNEYGQ